VRIRSVALVAITTFVLLAASNAQAALVRFTAVGSSEVSGFVEFDDSFFTSPSVSNAAITDLSLTVQGFSFDSDDVNASGQTLVSTSATLPRIIDGIGTLASNGAQSIAFLTEGAGGTPDDGDASLLLVTGTGPEQIFAVRFDAAVVAAPEPGTLALLALCLACLGFVGVQPMRPARQRTPLTV
jgi:hypothetical protein